MLCTRNSFLNILIYAKGNAIIVGISKEVVTGIVNGTSISNA